MSLGISANPSLCLISQGKYEVKLSFIIINDMNYLEEIIKEF